MGEEKAAALLPSCLEDAGAPSAVKSFLSCGLPCRPFGLALNITLLNFTAENNVLGTVSRELCFSLPVQAILFPLVLLSHLLLSHTCVSIHPVFMTPLIYFLLQISDTLAASSLILSVHWVIKLAECINILNLLQQFAHNICQNYL